MQYPLISEYINSILNAEDNFATMIDLRPVLHDDGTPVMSSGNFAVVFKMKDERDGKLYAVKCFTREQEERAENYRMIAEELGKVSSPYITPVKWLDGELFVDTTQTDETEFPVLLMDWIEGPTLSAFLQSIADQLKAGKVFKDNEYEMFELRCLPANFLRMASWLLKQPFAHGDLKPDNIIVQEDGYCVLVDYDGMYVPAMQGMPQTCMGTPNFTHPSQTEHTFNKYIDSYAITVIALSLQAFALRPSLIGESPDFCVITKQQALKLHTVSLLDDEDLMADNNIQELLSLFLHTLSQNKLDAEYFDKAIAETLVPKDFDIYNTEVSDEDLENCYEDRYGVKYNIEGRKVLSSGYSRRLRNGLSANGHISRLSGLSYRIREGVLSICNMSFYSCMFQTFYLPDSVLSIGGEAFAGNDALEHCNIPKSVVHICNNNPWRGCFNIKLMNCDSQCFAIKDGILYSADYRIAYGLIYFHLNIIIDQRTKIIAPYAFGSFLTKPSEIKTIDMSKNIEEIGDYAFCVCDSLQSITIPDFVKRIGNGAFAFCTSLKHVTIPPSLTMDPVDFILLTNLENINVTKHKPFFRNSFDKYSSKDGILFNRDFSELIIFPRGKGCLSYTIPSSVTIIREYAFSDNDTLQSIVIPDSVIQIYADTFHNCPSLKSIYIPTSNLDKFKLILPQKLHNLLIGI